MTCGFTVIANLIKPFFSTSLQRPRHNTANARDLAAHPVRNLLVDIEEAARMHSSNDAAQPSLKHANLFSFPPTQRDGLLDSPTAKAKRSTNQSLNLRASFERLQASLDKAFPEQARAI